MKKLLSITLFATLLAATAAFAQVPIIDTVQAGHTQNVYDTTVTFQTNSLFLIQNTGFVNLRFCFKPSNIQDCGLLSYQVLAQSLVMVSAGDLGLGATAGEYLNVTNDNVQAGTYIVTPVGKLTVGDTNSVQGQQSCAGDTYWKTDGNNVSLDPTCNPFVGTTTARELVFKTNYAEQMRITPTGEIGIGKYFPFAKLDVAGSALFSDNVGIGLPAVPTERLSVGGNALFSGDVGIGGNVGIGVPIPAAKLHIGGNPGSDGILFPDGSFQTTAAYGSGSQWLPGINPNDIYYGGGRVGIGTNNPLQMFEVKGVVGTWNVNGRFGSDDGHIDIGAGLGADINATRAIGINYYSNQNVQIGGSPNALSGFANLGVSGNINVGLGTIGNTGQITMYSPTPKLTLESSDDWVKCEIEPVNGYTRIRSNRGVLIFLDDDNNEVGEDFRIATNNSYYDPNGIIKELFVVKWNGDASVCGELKAKKVKVQTGWCDFVFKPGYEKMSWLEKEAFYTKEGHLPYVVSEKTIEENGLDVGETMSGMMQNIEEDRLDITELFKRMEKIEIENELLKKKIETLTSNK